MRHFFIVDIFGPNPPPPRHRRCHGRGRFLLLLRSERSQQVIDLAPPLWVSMNAY